VSQNLKINFDNSVRLLASVTIHITAYCVMCEENVIKIWKLCSRELSSERVLGLYSTGISENRGKPRVMGDTIV